MGIEESKLAMLRAPAGLDLRARRGDEIALSILAEIVLVRRGLEQIGWAESASGAEVGSAAPTAAAPAATAIDPVCGMTVDIATARATHEHEGTMYYFCCPGCRGRFAKDPVRFLAADASGA